MTGVNGSFGLDHARKRREREAIKDSGRVGLSKKRDWNRRDETKR